MLYADVYHEIKILIIPIIVIIVNKLGSFMIQLSIPIVIKMNENSLMGISAIPVKKLFLFTCHMSFRSHIVIIGLKTTTRNNPAAMNRRFIDQLNDKFDHNRTKYITIKKSLSTFILLVISNL